MPCLTGVNEQRVMARLENESEVVIVASGSLGVVPFVCGVCGGSRGVVRVVNGVEDKNRLIDDVDVAENVLFQCNF